MENIKLKKDEINRYQPNTNSPQIYKYFSLWPVTCDLWPGPVLWPVTCDLYFSPADGENTWGVNCWLWKTKTKPNTTVFHSCTIMPNIWENNKKLTQRTHVNINLKKFLCRPTKILRRCERKMKEKKKDEKHKPVILGPVVFQLC